MENRKEFFDRILAMAKRAQDWSYPEREYENVEVFISKLGKTYRYYMTNNARCLMKKLSERNYAMPEPYEFRDNPWLAKEVRRKMIELGVSYSFEDDVAHIVNYFPPWSEPMIGYLR